MLLCFCLSIKFTFKKIVEEKKTCTFISVLAPKERNLLIKRIETFT